MDRSSVRNIGHVPLHFLEWGIAPNRFPRPPIVLGGFGQEFVRQLAPHDAYILIGRWRHPLESIV
jgi:hypothetical protein